MMAILGLGVLIALKMIPKVRSELTDPIEQELYRRGFYILQAQKQIESIQAKSERVPSMLQNLEQRDELLDEYRDWELRKRVSEIVEKGA